MAAPLADKIILPLDTGNTGKKVRTQTRVVGADTVHEHFFVPISARKINAVARYNTGAIRAVTAAAENGTSGAAFWHQVPAAASIRVRVRKIEVHFGHIVATAIDHITAPRIAFSKFTFTGTPSGATLSPQVRKTGEVLVSDVRTAVTGMTVSLQNPWFVATVPSYEFTTSGVVSPGYTVEMDPGDEEEFIDLGPSEGLVCYQIDAGTTSDQRGYRAQVLFDEYDNA